MNDPAFDGQVIVVVEPGEPLTQAKCVEIKSTLKRKNAETPKKDKRKSIKWELLHKLPSTAAFHKWLKQKEAAGMKYTKKKSFSSWEGSKDFYGCLGTGCPVQLQVLFDSASEDVIIYHNGHQHTHKEKPHKGWGLREQTKMEVQRLYGSGVSKLHDMDARLRQLGHTDYQLKQLNGYLTRLRRLSKNSETVQEYSSLSVWGSQDRSSQESGTAEDEGGYSPPQDAEFDHSPPASPARPAPSARPAPPGSSRPAMDEATERRLVASSQAARRHSYSPYSRFPVGAALLCADGTIVTGCNVENASFGLTNCAERTAVFKAVSEGRRRFSAVAIAADMGDKFVGPCGACRQVLAEFNAEMPVILAKPNGELRRTSMKELLPMAFLPDEVPFKEQ